MNNDNKGGKINLPKYSDSIKKEFSNSFLLSRTKNNKEIRLAILEKSPNLLNEIARLREITFRQVGEGSGAPLDIDKFDEYYKHLILWDNENEEIVGAYRLCIGNEILTNHGIDGFYTSTLFDFTESFVKEYLPYSMEFGRSFIQPKYWRTTALDDLWHGIGALVRFHPDTKYFFGAVSISKTYSESAKNAIIFYYKKWFGSKLQLVKSKNQHIIPHDIFAELQKIFTGESSKKDYLILKNILRPLQCSVPILFKQYTDLCEEGGVKFLDFGVDEKFGGCIDGFILVDLSYVKKEKYMRYYEKNQNSFDS